MNFPEYTNSNMNIAGSVLRYFGVGGSLQGRSLPALDRILERKYKNIVLMLFDGLGTDVIERCLDEGSLLRRHFIESLTSVFPPTTTAATTSIQTALTPAEHGWMGWCLYFREIDKIVDLYPNTVHDAGDAQAADYNVARRFLPYKSVFDWINESGKGKAYSVSRYGTAQIETLDELFEKTMEICANEDKNYIYTYWAEPDSTMHETGYGGENIAEIVQDIDRRVEELCAQLKDTVVIVTADHGLTDLTHKKISDYPELMNMLERPTAMEPRACVFYVKEEYKDRLFPEKFRELFGEDFLLLSKHEVTGRQLFGGGEPHLKFEDFVGDYLAIGIAKTGLVYDDNSHPLAANHAGLTEQEMMVPLTVIEK